MSFDVVVPTVGRPSLSRLLGALSAQPKLSPRRVLVMDDRPVGAGGMPWEALGASIEEDIANRIEVIRTSGAGPAGARNAGWRAGEGEWVVFLDDDVIPGPSWGEDLTRDLERGADVGGSQGRVRVPTTDRPATDWERSVAGLADAQWATADMAYRRRALERVGGFDERFARAYREDTDIALRVLAAGFQILQGEREVSHPVGPSSFWTSVNRQRGNADDVLMRKLHGRGWRRHGNAPPGRLTRHQATVGATTLAVLGGLAARGGHRRARRLARLGAVTSAGLLAELCWARIAPGPRTYEECARMLLTSLLLPFAAVAHRVRGEARWRSAAPLLQPPRAILFDRDGTLIQDVPYNSDPACVRPMQGAREALDGLRAAGIRIGVVSNQSGIARGLVSEEELDAVNRRVEELLGPIEIWLHCPHLPEEDCGCRKPAPGLVLRAAELLDVPVGHCAVIGDIGSDVQAASAAGARSVLVPTGQTLAEEIAAAPAIAPDPRSAVRLLMG